MKNKGVKTIRIIIYCDLILKDLLNNTLLKQLITTFYIRTLFLSNFTDHNHLTGSLIITTTKILVFYFLLL